MLLKNLLKRVGAYGQTNIGDRYHRYHTNNTGLEALFMDSTIIMYIPKTILLADSWSIL